MKTMAEIEKIAEQLAADESYRHDYPYDLDARELESIYLKGFIDCMKLMLEREKVAKDALTAIMFEEYEIDWNQSQYYAKEALEKLK